MLSVTLPVTCINPLEDDYFIENVLIEISNFKISNSIMATPLALIISI